MYLKSYFFVGFFFFHLRCLTFCLILSNFSSIFQTFHLVLNFIYFFNFPLTETKNFNCEALIFVWQILHCRIVFETQFTSRRKFRLTKKSVYISIPDNEINHIKNTLFFNKQLGLGFSPQSCLYFQNFQGSKLLSSGLVVWPNRHFSVVI